MHLRAIATLALVGHLAQPALARPDMAAKLREIQERAMDSVAPRTVEERGILGKLTDIGKRLFGGHKDDKNGHLDSSEAIGDLLTLKDSELTQVGRSIKNLLTRTGNDKPESDESYGKAPAKDSLQCKADTCCIWKYISDEMFQAMLGKSGRCNDIARASVRLGFHDAAGWSRTTGPHGGADGSIVLNPEEIQRKDNRGLEEIVAQMKVWYAKYSPYGAGMADLIQMAANVATVTCPEGPRIRSFVGRKDSSRAAPEGLLPPVAGSASFLIEMFQNKTIQPNGLIALIGAHTTSQQRFVDPARAGDPQDSSPGVWDTRFYRETLGMAPRRVFKFASDIVLSQDPRTAPRFKRFAIPSEQDDWNEEYAREYIRLSLLGVDNINSLTECTKVLPRGRGNAAIHSFNNPFKPSDQSLVDKWMRLPNPIKEIADAMRKGDLLFPFQGNLWRRNVRAPREVMK